MGFSRDLFLLQVATRFISASQIVLVSRLIGLDAAAVWSVCTKFFTLAQLIVFKIYDYSAPGFSEMFVRGEVPRFRERLATIVSITAVGAGLFAVLGAFGNRTLIMLWTGGKVTWNELVDICAACISVPHLPHAMLHRCYRAAEANRIFQVYLSARRNPCRFGRHLVGADSSLRGHFPVRDPGQPALQRSLRS